MSPDTVATRGMEPVGEAVARGQRPIRVAVICDFLEENWPSMDLNGDMLCHFLQQDHAREIAATQVRPALHRRLMRIPLIRKPFAWNADRLMNRFVDYPRQVRRQRDQFDLFHVVDHSYAQLVHDLPANRTLVTCHDLDTFRCLLEPEREPRPRWFQSMAQRTLDGFRQAAHVICNSNATRSQLLRHGLFPPERVTVIHSGVHPAFAAIPDPVADARAAALLPLEASNAVVLLNVGSTIPRKRIDVLLRVFASVVQQVPETRLIRVGGPFTEAQLQLARELGVEQSVLVLPFLDRKELASVYRRAALLLQTSEAEGFGMPLAEAMACGCPVVASDLPVLREIGGTACAYCPVGDIGHWTQTVLGRLRERAEQNGRLKSSRHEALAWVKGFSWAENARRTAEIYKDVLQQSAPCH